MIIKTCRISRVLKGASSIAGLCFLASCQLGDVADKPPRLATTLTSWEHPFPGRLDDYPSSPQGWPVAQAMPFPVVRFHGYDVTQRYNNEGVIVLTDHLLGDVIYWCGKMLHPQKGRADIFRYIVSTQVVERTVQSANCSGFSESRDKNLFLAGDQAVLQYYSDSHTTRKLVIRNHDSHVVKSLNDLTIYKNTIYFSDSRAQKVYYLRPEVGGDYTLQPLFPEFKRYTQFVRELRPGLNHTVAQKKQKLVPNGISISHSTSGAASLLIMSLGPAAEGKQFPVLKIPLNVDGEPQVNSTQIWSLLPEGGDGAAVGDDGTLAVAGFRTGGVWILDPDGRIRGEVRGPKEGVVNTAFWGNQLILSTHQTTLSIAEMGSMPLYYFPLRQQFSGTNF